MPTLDRMGLLKTSLADYPGEVAAVLFTAGCNLACPYCHNPELVRGGCPKDFLSRSEIEAFLDRRARVLTGVCITGGEPLLSADIPDLVTRIHGLGLKVKLDTNGMLPERIAGAGADYVALDLKLSPDRYGELGAGADAARRLRRAIDAVRANAPEYEFRTTVVPGLVKRDDVEAIARLLEPGERYTLAAFRQGTTLDPAYAHRPSPSAELLDEYAGIARERGIDCRVRDDSVKKDRPSGRSASSE